MARVLSPTCLREAGAPATPMRQRVSASLRRRQEGRAGSLLIWLQPDMHLRYRGAAKRPVYALSPHLLRRAEGPSRRIEGDGAPKSANPIAPRSFAGSRRAPLGAPHAHLQQQQSHAIWQRFRHRAPLSIGHCAQVGQRPVAQQHCAQLGQRPVAQDQSVSQLLAGTPSGPGGSSNAARVLRCDEARGRQHLAPLFSRRLAKSAP